MKKFFISSVRNASRRQFSRCAVRLSTPSEKYVSIYNSEFEAATYPVTLLGGTQTAFAKLLYKFADEAEGKNFDLYLGEFEKLSKIAAQLGPFWIQADVMTDPQFNELHPGFRFVIGWMQNERMLDNIDRVKVAYQELADEITQRTRATITVPWEPSSKGDEVRKLEQEVSALHSKSGGRGSVVFQYKVAPEIKDGYIIEIANMVVNKTADARAAETTASAKELEKDWSAMPPLPPKTVPKHSELLVKLIGADIDVLADINEVERRVGA
jgi:hypothetical protein